MLIGRCGRRLIKIDEARMFFLDFLKNAALERARQLCRGNRCEKCDDVDLAVAASLFQHRAHLCSYCIRGSSSISGDFVHGLAGGETARDARLGGRQIE